MQKAMITHPECLEGIEAQHRQDLSTLVIKAIVLSCLDDTEKKESSKTCSPEHDEYAVDDLTGIMSAIHGNRDDGQEDKVGSTSYIVQLIGLESNRDSKENGLISKCDQETDGEIVIIENMNWCHVCGRVALVLSGLNVVSKM